MHVTEVDPDRVLIWHHSDTTRELEEIAQSRNI